MPCVASSSLLPSLVRPPCYPRSSALLALSGGPERPPLSTPLQLVGAHQMSPRFALYTLGQTRVAGLQLCRCRAAGTERDGGLADAPTTVGRSTKQCMYAGSPASECSRRSSRRAQCSILHSQGRCSGQPGSWIRQPQRSIRSTHSQQVTLPPSPVLQHGQRRLKAHLAVCGVDCRTCIERAQLVELCLQQRRQQQQQRQQQQG